MYPEILHIPFLHTYGALVALAFLAGLGVATRLAKRAGLNCGRCDSCLERKECEEYTLHRLRRTYITTMLRGGVDLRSVQAYAGHRLLETTMRYLAPQAAPDAQAKVNAVEW